MDKVIKKPNKHIGIILGTGFILILAIGMGLFLHRSTLYSPTTFAQLHHTSSHPTCLEKNASTSLKVDSQNTSYIGNAVATSIIDASAGTHVGVYFKTYNGSTATGTAVYGGKYGRYNFTAKKGTGDTGDPNFFGHWKVTYFQACKV